MILYDHPLSSYAQKAREHDALLLTGLTAPSCLDEALRPGIMAPTRVGAMQR